MSIWKKRPTNLVARLPANVEERCIPLTMLPGTKARVNHLIRRPSQEILQSFPATRIGSWTPEPLPVAGRLQAFRQAWGKLCDEGWVRSVISSGFRIPFSQPPLCSIKNFTTLFYFSRSIRIFRHRAGNNITTGKEDHRRSPFKILWISFRLFTIPKKTGDLDRSSV